MNVTNEIKPNQMDVCRACMCKGENINMLSIFEFATRHPTKILISELLTTTIPQLIQIKENDALSKIICVQCLDKLLTLHQFQQMCLRTEKHMLSKLGSEKTELHEIAEMSSLPLVNDSTSDPLQNDFAAIDDGTSYVKLEAEDYDILESEERLNGTASSEISKSNTINKKTSEYQQATQRNITKRSSGINHKNRKTNSEKEQDPIIQVKLEKMQQHLCTLEKKIDKLIPFIGMPPDISMTPTVSKPQVYKEFQNMKKFATDEELLEFEHKLNDQSYEDKFFLYLQTIYKMNGKRNSKVFFRTVIRQLTLPPIFIPYSWLGKKRMVKDKGQEKVSKLHKSFKKTFPNFIKFIHRVVKAGDYTFTIENNEKEFTGFLRHKFKELKRFNEDNNMENYKRIKLNDSADGHDDVNGDSNPKPFCEGDNVDGNSNTVTGIHLKKIYSVLFKPDEIEIISPDDKNSDDEFLLEEMDSQT